MKLGIISDLHLDFGDYRFAMQPNIHYINAGDLAHTHVLREYFHKNHPGIMTIPGNHDYYGNTGLSWLDAHKHTPEWVVEGLKIRGASLWTHMKDKNEFKEYARTLNDARCIYGMTYENYVQTHESHKGWLFDSDADVLVLHHAPSYLSIHPKYANDRANKFFANNLDNVIENMIKPPKLIIHGHVHSPFDYMIRKTRVVCYPRGYPGENVYYKKYKPMIVEI